MADEPDTDGNDAAEGGTARGNQGGHQGQPGGGQHPPQGGQRPAQNAGSQGEVPPGQPPQGQYQTGPSIGDIFSIPATKDEMKYGIIVYALVGIGAGLALFGITASSSGFGFSFGASLVSVPMAATIVIAAFLGLRQNEELADQPNGFAYATAAVTALAGSLLSFLLALILAMLGAGDFSFDGLALPLIMTGIGAAVVAAGIIWADRSLLAPSPVPRQPQGQARQPPQQPPE